MSNKMKMVMRAGLTGLVLGLTACATTAPTASDSAEIEAALPLVRTGAAVATGAVLDFAVKQSVDADAAGQRDVRGGECGLLAFGRHVPRAGAI